ncbi:hypothetical protein DICVIV_09326 [Dictyocaulus viviparus]|uniref:Peptidase A2 domain-containing protein n=1 Tax=Dictyocaulus viviparus TaxID=29172 RepID=A0A0D8XJ83_DICVI|nr:hypothetical protein DICVIV_09326 [Dictyocaulus viviparus]
MATEEIQVRFVSSDVNRSLPAALAAPRWRINLRILIGGARVRNIQKHTSEPIDIILDTGADRSFITSELSERLQLPNVATRNLLIQPFGTKAPIEKKCSITRILLYDSGGKQHEFTVTKIDNITKPLRRYELSSEDTSFLKSKNIKLSIDPRTRNIRPQLLLRCSDVFKLMDRGLDSGVTLPSELQLVPSKIVRLPLPCSTSLEG